MELTPNSVKARMRILTQVKFWSPLHRQLATAPLIRFEWLTEDRVVQRTTFRAENGEVSITVNFSDESRSGYPPWSASVAGPIDVTPKGYRLGGK